MRLRLQYSIVILAASLALSAALLVARASEEPAPLSSVRPQISVGWSDPNDPPPPIASDRELRGGCLVPKDAVEVVNDTGKRAGGRVFDARGYRFYSLATGRCVKLAGAETPPDWVTSELENLEVPVTELAPSEEEADVP